MKTSKFASLLVWVFCGLCWTLDAYAELKAGDDAPDFSTQAALAGQPFTFSLGEALKKGPVVLYFYPKAFTKGCSIEAKLFANKQAEFASLQATVVGVSNDDLDTLKKFSLEDCASKFAVASDPEGKIIKSYEASLLPVGHTAARVSYVITPDRKVLYAYQAMKPEEHVQNTLQAVRQWQAGRQSLPQ